MSNLDCGSANTADIALFCRWNRRMAYLHESAKMVLVQPPQSDEIPSDIQVSGNEDDMPSKEPSPELEEIVSPRKPGVKANGMSKKAHPLAKQIFHDDIVDSSDEEEEVAPVKVVTPAPSYVCGYADSRTGIICETRLASREERETHRRFVHSVRNNEFSAQSRFAQEAKQKMKKQLEQERVDKKLQGKKRKSKGDSDGDGVSILAVVAMHSKFKQQSVPETRK